ncbi:GTPase [[Phormidium] sp. LEGE 05292]|uniref:GTPase n=1 Tax=[Phormidium] sp. LEGE 05292 TaxID=767427 RepID=UPI002AD2A681|nr:GTPase [Phormidium sp. LEGE 05292]
MGQYSSGKSTIISALTGRRDIYIDADIATDKTTSYDWNGIKLIDTPGLFTERQDHDEITYDAINKSDLLVFCLTYMLFDSLTAENFKKLAYEKGYRWKMMLVINKMSDEAGEEDQKIANYSKSLVEALKPYSLDEFPICFIDAKDYCESVDEDDDFLREISQFPTFIDALNAFVKRRRALTKFDTPTRIALSYVDDAQFSLIRNNNQDSAFFELLNRLSRTVRQEPDRLRTKVRGIALKLSAAVANEGTILARAIGVNENIEALAKQAENNLKKYCEKAGIKIEEAVKAAVDSLQEDIKDVFQSDLAQAFVASLEVNQKVSAQNVDSGVDVDRLRKQVKLLKDIGERAGIELVNLATKTGANTNGQAFLKAANVAGGNLHRGVYVVGKFLGVNFRPWQAVNIAKGIANVAKILGPILAVGLLAVDIYSVAQEEEIDRKLADARREITSQFIAIGKDIESQIEAQLQEVETQLFGEFQKEITEARQQEEEAIGKSNKLVAELAEIRQEFEQILHEINKYGENA